MLTLNHLDAINADRLYRKLGRAREQTLARRRHRLQCRVFLHLHKALLRNHAVTRPNVSAAWSDGAGGSPPEVIKRKVIERSL